ncbi:NAD(P)/FAD-dependent oxidoreductase [Paucibacter sp. R3-3]|uniref:NAD(P)/FAD-dependent oxidoreductase n=1 Tax=Roseateles agri TaxID=3098619 RepID=A0ABU5DCY0_9BURK|nr:NAD(P)/FAD-dependent oxidoreductase [Paucibacter sp. R3-3]MDY0743568.1 NAD(P)/FAD-dependent oxidoreductase [Paucibacter sp. R3-3]
MAERVDAVVIGAGVVGLAVARALAQRGLETLVLERETAIGTGISSRNSEVIHAGLYYPQGSLKATLCVRGRRLLYEFCASHGVPHRRCGKLIVATSAEQVPGLDQLHEAGRINGVEALRMLTQVEAQAIEPQLRCVAALESAATGIVDSHALMLALRGDFEAAGGMLAFGASVLGDSGLALEVGGAEPMRIEARRLIVNAAGLDAPRLAAALATPAPRAWLAKGSYFALAGRAPFSRLVYPLPEPGGLGVHLTLDLAGQARFGPDVEWVDHIDYRVDPRRAEGFYAAIRRYWPALPDDALQPAYAGIRPKIAGPGEPAADFAIERHGGLVNLFGIESPGLTAALAIGERIASEV